MEIESIVIGVTPENFNSMPESIIDKYTLAANPS